MPPLGFEPRALSCYRDDTSDTRYHYAIGAVAPCWRQVGNHLSYSLISLDCAPGLTIDSAQNPPGHTTLPLVRHNTSTHSRPSVCTQTWPCATIFFPLPPRSVMNKHIKMCLKFRICSLGSDTQNIIHVFRGHTAFLYREYVGPFLTPGNLLYFYTRPSL